MKLYGTGDPGIIESKTPIRMRHIMAIFFEHKNKIDFNYNNFEDGDIMHANGIAYNFKY
jgi:hypothetical protein